MFDITKSKTTDYQSPFSTVGAIFIGISVPLVASRPTVMAISALLGFIFIFLSPGRKDLLRLMLSKALKPLALVIICLFLAWLPAVFDSIDIEKSLNGSNILIIGVSYKKDIDDIRESPALDIIQLLLNAGVKLDYYDPYVPRLEFNDILLESILNCPSEI